MTSIGECAFHGCVNLKSVTIPDSVTGIDAGVFANCDSLTDIYYGGSEEQWNPVIIYPYFDYSYLDRVNMHYSGVSSAQPTAAPQTGSFSDVPSNYWAYDNIKRITELGGFKGYEDGTFKPENQITHEEFLKVVISLMYKGDANAAPASALGASWDDWAKPTLNTAVDAGIVKADGSDILAANTPITRVEMAKIISRRVTIYRAGDEDESTFKMSGYDNTEGMVFQNGTGEALFNIENKYKELKVMVGHIDGAYNANRTLNVYIDGALMNSYTLYYDRAAQEYDIPLLNSGGQPGSTLKLEIKDVSYNEAWGFAYGRFE